MTRLGHRDVAQADYWRPGGDWEREEVLVAGGARHQKEPEPPGLAHGIPLLLTFGTPFRGSVDALNYLSNGFQKRGGIVWTSFPLLDGQWQNGSGRLVAFDAASLRPIWFDDGEVNFAKFNPPTIADGKVFRATFSNMVRGDIRELWLKLGGPQGKLGFPTSDERLRPDFKGRYSIFEHGEIWWYPDRGAYVRPAPRKGNPPARNRGRSSTGRLGP